MKVKRVGKLLVMVLVRLRAWHRVCTRLRMWHRILMGRLLVITLVMLR